MMPRSRSPRRDSPPRDRREDRGADRHRDKGRDDGNYRTRGHDRPRDRRDDRYPDRPYRRRTSRSRSPARRSSHSISPQRDRRDRDRQQLVPFGERSLREEKQKEKTPAEIAEEQRQAKLQQIDALLHRLHHTQQQPAAALTAEHKEQPTATTPTTTTTAAAAAEEVKEQAESEESVEAQLMALMGLPVRGFDSTKGKEVKDGNVSGVKVATQRKFRQVMKNNKGQPITTALNTTTTLRRIAPHSRAGSRMGRR